MPSPPSLCQLGLQLRGPLVCLELLLLLALVLLLTKLPPQLLQLALDPAPRTTGRKKVGSTEAETRKEVQGAYRVRAAAAPFPQPPTEQQPVTWSQVATPPSPCDLGLILVPEPGLLLLRLGPITLERLELGSQLLYLALPGRYLTKRERQVGGQLATARGT